jgi:hypothetical protein
VPDDVPARRTGSRAGYTGKAELDAASARFRRAVSRLARDREDEGRLAGARIVAEATEVLNRLATDAEAAWSVNRIRAEQAARKFARLEVKLEQLTQKGHHP